MNINQDVAIFWNLGKALPDDGTNGYAVVEKIRTIAHTFGIIKSFRVYFDGCKNTSGSMNHLRMELHQSGVSVMECSTNGIGGDYADKVMSVDILLHGFDHPATTIFIISGEPHLAYLVSTLRSRRHHVILIAPSNAHIGLKIQADHAIDWEPIGFASPVMSPNNAESATVAGHVETVSQMPEISAAAAGSSGYIITGSETRLQYHADAKPIAEISIGAEPVTPRPPANSYIGKIPKPDANPTPRSHSPTMLQVDTGSNKGKDRLFPFSEPGDTSPLLSTVKGVSPNLRLHNPFSDCSDKPSLFPVIHAPFDALLTNNHLPAPSSGGYELISNSASGNSETSSSSFSVISSAPIPSTAATSNLLSAGPSAPKWAPTAETQRSQSVPPFTLNSNAANFELPSNLSSTIKVPEPSVESSQRPQTVPPVVPNPSGGAVTISRAPAERENTKRGTTSPLVSKPKTPPSSQPAATHAPTVAPDSSSLPKVVPAPYIPLVKILKQHRIRGKPQPERSIVAAELKKLDSEVYKRANTTQFKPYTMQAEKAGLVHLGHDDLGTAWIALRPEWHDSIV